MPPDMAAWMKRAAAKQRVGLSTFLKLAVMQAFEARHAK